MDEVKRAEIAKLIAAWQAAHAEAHAASGRVLAGWSVGKDDDVEITRARKRSGEVRAAAREAYDVAAGEAEKRIRAIDDEADEARLAVLRAHEAELAHNREIVEAARTTMRARNVEADAIDKEARDAVRDRLRRERDEAHKAERAALIDVVRVVAGGPVVAPIPFKHGRQRSFDLRCTEDVRLSYRLYNRDKRSSLEDRPTAVITVEVSTPTPDTRTDTTRISIGTGYVEGETLKDAVRNAEDAAIAEGWMTRKEEVV